MGTVPNGELSPCCDDKTSLQTGLFAGSLGTVVPLGADKSVFLAAPDVGVDSGLLNMENKDFLGLSFEEDKPPKIPPRTEVDEWPCA